MPDVSHKAAYKKCDLMDPLDELLDAYDAQAAADAAQTAKK